MASKESDSIIEQRTYIKFRTKLGFAPKAIFEELVIVCPDSHLSYSRVREWEPPSKKARPDRFGHKVLYTIFFDTHESVAQICLPKCQRVTGEYYATTCLAAVEQHYKERRPRTICKGLQILHDNARPHKTRLVKDTLDSLGVVELQHPPYSPDLSPCDF